MIGKVWACCIGLLLSTLACGGASKAPAPATARTVVVNLEGTTPASRASEARLPALGAPTAPVTIVALLAFSDAESAVVYQALRRLQAQLGERELRLVLVTPGSGQLAESAEVMAETLQHDRGDAAYFDFATRMFTNNPTLFGDTLRLAIDVSLAHAEYTKAPNQAEPDSSGPVVRAEADALVEAPEALVPALSVNGIRVLGRLRPTKLEELIKTEHAAARALASKGVEARAIYPERVASNADRVVRNDAAAPAPAAAAEAPPPAPAADAPTSVTASHILFSYQGALRARPEVTRSKAEARALAEDVLGRLREGTITFYSAVAQYSDEPNAAERKGALGSFTRERMVKPFADAAFALAPGAFSDVVETQFGFHIIWRQQ